MESSTGAKIVRASKSQSTQNTPPPRKLTGIITIGFVVFTTLFTRCGTAIPTNEIGPANAVTQADNQLDNKISITRSGRIDTPTFCA